MDLQPLIFQYLPTKRRKTPQGWWLMNARCCEHKGHRPDSRMRGNLKFSDDGQIGGNCYNCGFKFRFDGHHLSDAFEQWLTWIGMDRSVIQSIKLDLLSKQMDGTSAPFSQNKLIAQHKWESVSLPDQAENMINLLEDGCDLPAFLKVVQYVHGRGEDILNGYDYYWSPQTDHQLRDRVIIPFYHNSDIVGWCARYAGKPPSGASKYFNSAIPPGYLFNQNILQKDRAIVLVCEGQFDAIALQGVAVMGHTLSDLQIQRLLQSEQAPVIVPDRQKANQGLIDAAVAFGWGVSFPDWEESIKDAADACERYGQLYTITSALSAISYNDIEINIKRNMFQG